GIDADVIPVGGANRGAEGIDRSRRNDESFGEENDGLATGQTAKRGSYLEQPIHGGNALLLTLKIFRRLEFPQLHSESILLHCCATIHGVATYLLNRFAELFSNAPGLLVIGGVERR